MGLDLYVGSLTRYYSGDWEMTAQKVARELGLPLEIVRQHDHKDAIRDPCVIRPAVETWREQLSIGLAGQLGAPLDWEERDAAPYFTDKPTWSCYSDLVLWAAYSEHEGLVRPVQSVEKFGDDPAYQRSTSKDFNSRYSHLFEVEWWLPCDFGCIFQTEKIGGGPVLIGSSMALSSQLEELNARTWREDPKTWEATLQRGSESGAPLEDGAHFAFAVFHSLARKSTEYRLPMLLDY